MLQALCETLGFYLYCVTFTITDKSGKCCGLFIKMVYAQDEARAVKKTIRQLNRHAIMFSGDWDINVEEV